MDHIQKCHVVQAKTTKLKDSDGTDITVGATSFPLTGIIVGGQRRVGFDYKPLNSADAQSLVYDSQVKKDNNSSAYLLSTAPTATDAVHTLLLQSLDGEDETIILEFENNCKDGDNNGVIFATVTDISGTTVTVTEIDTKEIPARTPFFITNTSNAQSIRMEIGNYDAVAVADGFLGTAEEKNTSDQGFGPWNMLEDMKYYGFNGTDFVWIREPGHVAAHRCWIQLATGGTGGALARMLNIDWPDGSATGISTINAGDTDSDNWYDLNGRKLQGKPQKKGLYIRNGQKMVVK